MKKSRIPLILIAALCTACGTVSTPFVRTAPDFSELPAEDLRSLAHDIEKTVHEGNRGFTIEDRGQLIVNDPAIVQAIRTRAARNEILSELLDTGFAWEKRNGLVVIIRNKAYKQSTTSRERDRNALIVLGEKFFRRRLSM